MDNSKILPAKFFETEASGRMPVREWLLELPPEDRKIVGNEIRTAEIGWPVGMPLCRSINLDIWARKKNVPVFLGWNTVFS